MTRLKAALGQDEKPHVTPRQLATQLVTQAGTRGKDPVGSKKSQIVKWTQGDHAISEVTGRELVAAFNALGRSYPADWFSTSPAAQTWHDEMREIAEATMAPTRDQYHREMQQLRAEMDRRHEEVLEELREIRKAI